jgi:hypothetical protein
MLLRCYSADSEQARILPARMSPFTILLLLPLRLPTAA